MAVLFQQAQKGGDADVVWPRDGHNYPAGALDPSAQRPLGDGLALFGAAGVASVGGRGGGGGYGVASAVENLLGEGELEGG